MVRWAQVAASALLVALVVSLGATASTVDVQAKSTDLRFHQMGRPPGEYNRYPELDRLATIFAMRPAYFLCPTPETWAKDPLSEYAWAYTTLFWDYAIVAPELCDAAMSAVQGRTAEPWLVGVAVSTLVHEMYHVRLWSARGDEGRVQCKAVRHTKVAMHLLGIDESVIERSFPWALVDHWRIARLAPDYYQEGCGVPNPW